MDYSALIPRAKQFYAALAKDNSRAFWDANKPDYDRDLKAPALALLDEMTPFLAEMTGDPVTPKLFRPHRDVRFSSDKRPYKEHIHMIWHVEVGGRQDPAFFFGISPDYVTVGAGIMNFSPAVLADWRKLVDLDAQRLSGIAAALAEKGYGYWEPELKRVPRPYPADHPHADFLRMKALVCTRELGVPDDLPAALRAAFTELNPLVGFLATVVCA